MTLVRGRAFTDADRRGRPEVAVVSEDVAARTWPGEDPIGKRIKLGRLDSGGCLANRGRRGRARRAIATWRRRGPTLYLPADAVHRRGRDAGPAHGLAPGARGPLDARARARRRPGRAGHARGALPGAAPRAARPASLQCVPDRRVRHGCAAPGAVGLYARDGRLRPPAPSGDGRSRRPRRHRLGSCAASCSGRAFGSPDWARRSDSPARWWQPASCGGLLFGVHPLDPVSLLAAGVILWESRRWPPTSPRESRPSRSCLPAAGGVTGPCMIRDRARTGYRRRTATASISICPPPGRSATARNVRAGKGWGRVAV